ncbi:MAG: hypothetical protein R2752_13055 [Vicinamibacterales bacterium]
MTLADALSRAQIVATCTTATTAFLGRHDSAGHLHRRRGRGPPQQEIEPALLASSRVVVDALEACAANGDLRVAIEAGAMVREDVHGELGAIAAGTCAGRSRPEEIFVLDSVGTAVQDAGAALHVYDRALATGRGVAVSFA